jgi:predicted secreted protein
METDTFIFDHFYPIRGRIVRDTSKLIKLEDGKTNTIIAYKVETAGFNGDMQVYSATFYLPEEELPIEDKERAIVKKI